MRTLIRNGTVVDGSGSPPYAADLLLEDDRIAAILPRPQPADVSGSTIAADCTIDAGGMVVTPGFIDTHRHCDLAVLTDPDFGTIELAQGITTTLSGNCGLTPFPTVAATRQGWHDFLEPCLGAPPVGLMLNGFPDYLRALQAVQPGINIGGMIGTGAVKTAVKGYDRSPFTPDELARARFYLDEALQNGAFGISTGIMYVPECYNSRDEYVELLGGASRFDAMLTSHIRGEGDSLLTSVAEILEIAQRSQLRLNISHFKAFGVRNWGSLIHKAIEKIAASGADVTVDFYPYTGGSTTLMTLLPPSVIRETLDATLAELARPSGLAHLKQQLQIRHDGWDNMIDAIGWERIVISSLHQPHNRPFIGQDLAAIAIRQGYADPVDLLRDLLIDESGKVGIIVMSMAPADVDAIARLPYAMVISDSLYGNPDHPHPRLYGSFARIIRDYVVDRQILPLETAIHKMSGQPAARFGIRERGLIRPGYYADLNIFDPAAIRDPADFTAPMQLSTGMDTVLLNGQIAWHKQQRTDCAAARILVKSN